MDDMDTVEQFSEEPFLPGPKPVPANPLAPEIAAKLTQSSQRIGVQNQSKSLYEQTPADSKVPIAQKRRMPILVQVDRGNVITMDEGGTPNGYGETQEFVEIDDLWYPLPFIKSIQGLKTDQISWTRRRSS